MKEKVLEAFCELGFKTEYIENTGYAFQYEGKNFLYIPNEEDEDFLNISIPGIYDYKEENALQFQELTEKLNSTLKYVKAYKFGDSLWIFYERELFGGEDIPQVMSRMILHLEAALFFAYKFITDDEQEASADNNPTDK